MTAAMITVNQVSKSFQAKVALDNISFTVERGQIFGFLGPSGSGKTTLIKILTNQLKPDGGQTSLLGKSSDRLQGKDFEQIGIVSDQSGYFEKLSLYNNLLAYGKLYGRTREAIDELLRQVGLYDSRDTIAEKLSTGMRQRFFLARALINRPQLLFLDEPTSGLDPMTSKSIQALLMRLKSEGTTIFLTTHDMQEATMLCDHLALLNKGHIVAQGSPEELIRQHTTVSEVTLTYQDGQTKRVSFTALATEDLSQVYAIHSAEPNLEDIFIALTGDQLHD